MISVRARYGGGDAAAAADDDAKAHTCDARAAAACALLRAAHTQVFEKKTTLGWVVNGGRRHAERQGELIPRGYGVGNGSTYYCLRLLLQVTTLSLWCWKWVYILLP
jgi:hypothetical protein